jgi:hypothetical protein
MAVRMQEEYEGDLNIVFVEVQGSSADEIEKLALAKKWLGTSAMWTSERPMITGARGIPNCVLLSADGEVVAMGHPGAMHQDIEEHVKQSRRARSRAPDELPKELSGAWKELAKGRIAAAVEAAQRVLERPPSSDGDAVVEAAQAFIDSARNEGKRRLTRIDNAIDEGAYESAATEARALIKDLDGIELVDDAKTLLARLEGDEMAGEVAAERDLAKIERRLFSKGPDNGTARALSKLAEKHAGTKAAERAQRWAALSGE